jgi:hypothetical protein
LNNNSESSVQITLTISQCQAVADALDFYSRICIGQLEEVASLVSDERIPLCSSGQSTRKTADPYLCDKIMRMMEEVKITLGYPKNGSHGIGHTHVHKSGHRAYEIQKVLNKTLAEYRDPNPGMRGVHYDGLGPRYTTDPAPTAVVVEKSA